MLVLAIISTILLAIFIISTTFGLIEVDNLCDIIVTLFIDFSFIFVIITIWLLYLNIGLTYMN